MAIDWIEIRGFGNRSIGAVGFVGGDAVAIVAFHDDRDGDKDGTVSLTERVVSKLSPIGIDGKGVTEVAMAARVNTDVMTRDATVGQWAGRIFTEFGQSMVMDGAYAAYFSRGVRMTASGVAKVITGNMVRQFVIRKGFEKAAKEAFDGAVAT